MTPLTYSGFRARYLAGGRDQAALARFDIWGRRKDGSEFPAEIGHSTIETYEGTMVLSAITDITERKAALARTEAALKEKTVLLNEIHHRVKNNLNVIANLLDLQAKQTQNLETRQALTLSQGRVNAMALIHQLLYERSDFERGPIFRTGKLMLLYQLARSFHETYSPSYFSRRI